MQTQIFLIAPADAALPDFARSLTAVLDAHPVAALLLPRGSRAENAYKDFCRAVIPLAQAHDCAVLIEGQPGLVRMLGADGLQLEADLERAREALAALHPGMIVGISGLTTRDDVMTFGELEPDYLLFGPGQRDMAAWWAETMEIPAVYADPEAGFDGGDAAGCEFLGIAMPVPEPAL